MIETDDMVGAAAFAAGCQTLALDGVHRRYRSKPIDAPAEPKSASVRLISCVHFESKATGKPFIVSRSAVAARHDHCSDSLPPEVRARIVTSIRLNAENSIFAPAAIEMQFDCVRM